MADHRTSAGGPGRYGNGKGRVVRGTEGLVATRQGPLLFNKPMVVAKAVFTLGKNDVHIRCTENLKQCHA